MEVLGSVIGITSEGNLTVKCEGSPGIGDFVFDQKHRQIGRVRRLMGPVDSPYVSVSVKNSKGFTGRTLFFKGKNRKSKIKKRS